MDASQSQLATAASRPAKRKGLFRLSPINHRRWRNFKANRRGYVSFWILCAAFVLSLFAEVIANDKPIIASYKGELLFPILIDYPEEKFGGFLATTEYRDPVIANEIAAHGWMIWPPIRFSYLTVNRDVPVQAPSPPTWSLDDNQCQEKAALRGGSTCRDIEWNWLGTDDQARDVLSRAIYGFRLSLLFGLVLTGISSVIGVAAGAVQGYFGGWTDLFFQRFIEIWTSVPQLYLIIILSAFSNQASSFCSASY